MEQHYYLIKSSNTIAETCAEEIEGIQVVKGLIATGDSFMNDPNRVAFVRSKFTDLQAAAVAQVAHQFGTPFVVIRSLSAIAGKESNVLCDEFLETVALHSAELVMKMVASLQES